MIILLNSSYFPSDPPSIAIISASYSYFEKTVLQREGMTLEETGHHIHKLGQIVFNDNLAELRSTIRVSESSNFIYFRILFKRVIVCLEEQLL